MKNPIVMVQGPGGLQGQRLQSLLPDCAQFQEALEGVAFTLWGQRDDLEAGVEEDLWGEGSSLGTAATDRALGIRCLEDEGIQEVILVFNHMGGPDTITLDLIGDRPEMLPPMDSLESIQVPGGALGDLEVFSEDQIFGRLSKGHERVTLGSKGPPAGQVPEGKTLCITGWRGGHLGNGWVQLTLMAGQQELDHLLLERQTVYTPATPWLIAPGGSNLRVVARTSEEGAMVNVAVWGVLI